MGNNMRNEFEEYVKKLTTAICKDILLEKMEKLYNKYEAGYQKFDVSAKNVMDAGNLLKIEATKANTKMKEIDTNTHNVLAKISEDIEVMEKDSKEMFAQLREENNESKEMFAQLREENNESKEQFIRDLSAYIEKYKNETAVIFEEGNQQISDKLAGIITPELLQDLVEEIEKNTRKSQELVTFINETYEREIEDTIKKILADTKTAQETMNGAIAVYVKKVLSDLENASNDTENRISQYAQTTAKIISQQLSSFQNDLVDMMKNEKVLREEYFQRQVELVKKIGPSDKKIQELTDQVVHLEHLVEERDRVNAENLRQLQDQINSYMDAQKELERKKSENAYLIEQQAASVSWRIYMAFSNTALICLFAVLIMILKPWEIFGVEYTAMVTIGFIIVLLLVLILRKVIGRAIAKRRVEKYAKQFE